LREKGVKIGLMRVRTFRPFPGDEIYSALKGRRKAFVIDRNLSFGHSGIFYEEIKAALYNKPERVPLYGFVAGLGGRDVDPSVIHQVVSQGMEREDPDTPVIWIGVKK
jgi:pyruvate/2-oxoacid:ferredoxin oxidoreductase alpha subunit